ncbi:MAG: hypothetical protein LBF62_08575 [Tannerellaceae bacterium]|jgi:mRNA-degrading endonuclease RelE of RelBE toxin-antitoxin system|nr:hypothetical protein [Tannerellaceae bacterium]
MIYELEYTPEAEKDVKALQKAGEKPAILKLRKLNKHRLVYSIDDEEMTILILSASSHYGDK